MIKVRFLSSSLPTGLLVLAQEDQTLFELARKAGVAVPTACVGKGTCGLCRVKIRAGESLLSPFNDTERKHLGNVYFLTKMRLSCQARIAPSTSPPPAAGDGASTAAAPTAFVNPYVEVEIPHTNSPR